MSETPTNPGIPESVRIPASEGIIATAGKQPLSRLLDLNGDGIPDYQQKWFRDGAAKAAYGLLGALFPGSPWAMTLKSYQPEILAIVTKGTK